MLTVTQDGMTFKVHCKRNTFEIANADGMLRAWGQVEQTNGTARHIDMWDGVRANNKLRAAIAKTLTPRNFALAYLAEECRIADELKTRVADEDFAAWVRPIAEKMELVMGFNIDKQATEHRFVNCRTGQQMDAWDFVLWSRARKADGREVIVIGAESVQSVIAKGAHE
jgi:hypothetical protein